MKGADPGLEAFVARALAGQAAVLTLPEHQIDFLPGGEGLVVSFEPVADQPVPDDFDRPVWGQGFLQRRGLSVLGFKRRHSDWYREPRLHRAMRALEAAGFFRRFRRVMFYGSSMGGHAALAYAPVSPGCIVLALNPQSTLAPARCWFDQRFAGPGAAAWEGDFVDGADGARAASRVYLCYDPYQVKDRLHAQRLPLARRINLRLPFAGHATPKLLSKVGLLGPVFDKAWAGSLTEAEFRRLARERVKSADYHLRLAERGVFVPRRLRVLDTALALEPGHAAAAQARRLLLDAGDGNAPASRPWPAGLVIAPRVPLVYLPVPMAASLVIQRHLLTLALGPSADAPAAVEQDERLWRSRRPEDGAWVERCLADGGLSFTFVRDPGRRAYACFTKRVMATGPRGFGAVRRLLQEGWGLRPPADGEALSVERQRDNFAAYLAFVEANLAGRTSVRRDPHWDLQSPHLARLAQVAAIDYVGRVEDFASDMAWLLHRANVRRVVDLRRRPPARLGTLSFDDIITPALQAQLDRIYARDYTDLGYRTARPAGRRGAVPSAFSPGHPSEPSQDPDG
jgi:hypothetical protein